jgi:hypothetical protein
MRRKEFLPLAKLIAEDNRFKKALKREFPKLVRLVQDIIDEDPKSPASKRLEIQLKRIKKALEFPVPQHGRIVDGLFVKLQENEGEEEE